MSTRAMARQYSSGGGGRGGWDSLDLFGGKERAANRQADKAAELEVKLQQQIAEIEKQKELAINEAKARNDRRLKKLESRLDTTKNSSAADDRIREKYGISKESWLAADPIIRDALIAKTGVEKNTSDATAAHQTGKLNTGLSEGYQKETADNIIATLAKPGVENSAALRTIVPPGSTGVVPFNAPGLAKSPKPEDFLTATGATETQVEGPPTIIGGQRFAGPLMKTEVPGQIGFPLDVNARKKVPLNPAPIPAGGQVGTTPFNSSVADYYTDSMANYTIPPQSLQAAPQPQFRGIGPHALEMLQDLPSFPRRLGQGTIDNVIRPSGDFLKYLLFGPGRQQ